MLSVFKSRDSEYLYLGKNPAPRIVRFNLWFLGYHELGEKPTCLWQKILSLLWLIAIIVLLPIGIVRNLVKRYTVGEHALFVLSYSLYLMPAIIATCCRLAAMLSGTLGYQDFHIIKNGYIRTCVDRILANNIDLTKWSIVLAFAGLFWTVLLFFFNMFRFLCTACVVCPLKTSIVVGEIMGMYTYLSFCNVLYILVQNTEITFRESIVYLKKMLKDTDSCRRNIVQTYDNFLLVRSFTTVWMALQVAVSSVLLFCHIYWAYNNYEHIAADIMMVFANLVEVVCFLVFPLISMGGSNVNWIHEKFVNRIEQVRTKKNEKRWSRIVGTIERVKPLRNTTSLVIIGTVIGVMIALNVHGQGPAYEVFGSICTTAGVFETLNEIRNTSCKISDWYTVQNSTFNSSHYNMTS
ncbi:uncharacterized protein [Ptychodera flava]|uniref:uncharacterized protein n=1 Tax=Ptychodera flava TaxID=63121 RepID=UPI00396A0129